MQEREEQNGFYTHGSFERYSVSMLKVRMRYGMEGYGIYHAILEKIYATSSKQLNTDYDAIGFDLRVGSEKIKSIVEDFDLFEFTEDGKHFAPKNR